MSWIHSTYRHTGLPIAATQRKQKRLSLLTGGQVAAIHRVFNTVIISGGGGGLSGRMKQVTTIHKWPLRQDSVYKQWGMKYSERHTCSSFHAIVCMSFILFITCSGGYDSFICKNKIHLLYSEAIKQLQSSFQFSCLELSMTISKK